MAHTKEEATEWISIFEKDLQNDLTRLADHIVEKHGGKPQTSCRRCINLSGAIREVRSRIWELQQRNYSST